MLDRRKRNGGRVGSGAAKAASGSSVILDQHGRSYAGNNGYVTDSATAQRLIKTFSGYVQGLYGLDAEPIIRAQTPYHNHAWVYAAATVTARNIAQASLGVWVETKDEIRNRAVRAKRIGRSWTGPRAGKNRTANARHLRWKGRRYGFSLERKGLEQDPEHEISMLLARPNPVMSGQQLVEATVLWLQLRGESFWVLTAEDGKRLGPGDTPEEIWPLIPERFRPIKIGGRLVGWKVSRSGDIWGLGAHTEMRLNLDEVVQFKFTNPSDPIRGMSPITAAAAGITIDLLATAHNKSLLANGAEPSGLIAFDGDFENQEEEDRFREQWEARHKGPANTGRLGFIPGGSAKYFQVGLSQSDMQYLEQRRWDRDEILAVEGVPKAMLSITDDLNYATAMAQKKTFWDELLFPIIRMIEDVLDVTLLAPETDNIMAAFDTSGVEALKTGLGEKIADAKGLTGSELHMPPDMALEIVGVDVGEYPGDDVALVTPMLVPVTDILTGLGPAPPPDAPPDAPPDEDPPESASSGDAPPDGKAVAVPLGKQSRANLARWRALMVGVQEPLERVFAAAWKKWLRFERNEQLRKFDEIAGVRRAFRSIKQNELDLTAVLTDLGETQQRLGGTIRPIYSGGLDEVFGFTVQELGGIPVFSIDDPRIMDFFDEFQKRIVGTTPVTLQRNLRRSLQAGLTEGETLGQLRQRVAEVYNIAGSDAKTLQVARTETAGFMNGTRNVMFEAQGFKNAEWVTAGNENVRTNHKGFGELGPRPLTHDYLQDRIDPNTGTGRLLYPSDPLGPAAEVINCLCIHIPIAE